MKKEFCKKIVNNRFNLENEDEKNFFNFLLNKEIIKKIDDRYIFNKKYKLGIVHIKQNKNYLESFIDDKTYIIDQKNLLDANDGDFVLTKVIFNPRGKTKVKVEKILEQNSLKNLVYLKENKLYSVKNNLCLEIDIDTSKFKPCDLLLVNDKVVEYFGNLNDAKIDDKISLYLYKEDYRLKRYDIKNIEKKIDYSNRVDLTHLNFCTIDPTSAKDHDDAIYYDAKETTLYVAIADVSHYVKEGSILDKEAFKRAFSVYFPNKVLPMLPFVLSAGLCSLKPNQIRYSFVCKIKLDTKNIKVISSDFIEAIIESKNNFSYEYIDQLIKDNKLPQDLNRLYNITKKFRKKRLLNGYDFKATKHQLILDEDENLIGVNKEYSSPSHQLVEECMLLANKEAAKKLENVGIFRVHEEPDLKKLDKLFEALSALGIKAKRKKDIHSTIVSIQQKAKNLELENEVDKLIIEAQQQARYSSIKSGHFGLGFLNYSHFTSPIRRYADLVLHRILKTKQIPQNIDTICEDISNKERQIISMVWDLEGRKYARWAKDNIGTKHKAIIVEVEDEPKGELIEAMAGLRFYIVDYKGEKLYNEILVEIESADIISKDIFARIV